MSTLFIKLVYINVNTCLTYSDNVKEVQKMRKQEQVTINTLADKIWEQAFKEFENEYGRTEPIRLRSCKAYVVETTHYYFLKSYSTYVAVIDKEQDVLIDMLRYVYGYTNTSAQHIAKFSHDYGKGYFGCNTIYRWREI